MGDEGRAEVTGHAEDANSITIKGRYTGASGSYDYWVKFDKKTKKIVDYAPK
jgi:hypothetical protein